ncbi:MAG: GNAT family N-acetyltransferase [Bdellovibrionales bacterium]|nr:GNAT family N-acetyltransferase [Bdellovibrionales bacterium]
MLTLNGKSIFLQEFTEDRLSDPSYLMWMRDLEVVTGIYRLEYLLPLSPAEIEKYVHRVMKSERDFFFSIHEKNSGLFIGTVKLGHVDWRTGSADVGILIGDRGSRGRGYSTDAVRTICDYGIHKLSLRKLTGGTASNNHAMIKCFEKVGFVREGTLRKKLLIDGEYVDHILFGLFREEFGS